jgi:alpha 1,2-mannosyltransferase
MKPAIVYLAQNKVTSAGNRRMMLKQSLDLLYENYNNRFKHPVLIFHEGDFDARTQKQIIAGKSEIEFHMIHFKMPSFIKKSEAPELWRGHTIGYRHMCRFYAFLLYGALSNLGYDWYLRMDDDSYIWSKIDYSLFDFMKQNGYEYGYRVESQEPKQYAIGFSEAVCSYLKTERIEADFFCQNLERVSLKACIHSAAENYRVFRRMNLFRTRQQWNGWCFYNNFHITELDFWRRADVRRFLLYLDRMGGAYKCRWGDALVQTAAIQIFMPPARVYKFQDWTYEHASVCGGDLGWGGIYRGSCDPAGESTDRVERFRKKYGKTHSDRTR